MSRVINYLYNMIFVHLFACSSTSAVSSLYVSGGKWEILPSVETLRTSMQLEGLGGSFVWDDRMFVYCLSNCVGQITWPSNQLILDSNQAVVNIHSFKDLTIRSQTTNLMIYNSVDVDVHALYGDVWVDAPLDARISIFSHHSDVDVNLPKSDWAVALQGTSVYSQVESVLDSKQILQVYGVDSKVQVVEFSAIGEK